MMERPNGRKQPVKRQVTAEIMYLHDRWENGQQAGDYSALSDMARRKYEEDAASLAALGGQGLILDVYEKYDTRSDLSYSCEALATELLKFHGDYSDGMREDFEVVLLPHEVLARVRALQAGNLLAGDDEQLALSAGPDGESALDIRKEDAVLTGVYLSVMKSAEDRKYAITSQPGVEPQYPRDFLAYPSDEIAYRYFIEIAFEYYHPAAEIIQETLGLHINAHGELSVERDMFIPDFSGAASEGLFMRTLENISDQDIAALADVVAEIVGDTPIPMQSHNNYDDVKEYIRTIPNSLTRTYLTEWLDNTSQAYVRHQLATPTSDGPTLRDALVNPTDTAAHDAIASLVNYDRQAHNERVHAAHPDNADAAAWRDRIQR